jgi:hypothetical protein
MRLLSEKSYLPSCTEGSTEGMPGPPEAVKKLNQMSLTDYGFESQAENARGARVPPGGAGAPAHASCRKEPIFNFFTAPLEGGTLFS